MTTTALAAPRPAFVAATTARAVRTVARNPGLLVSPVAMSLFFMLVYAGQLSTVGPGYLGGTSFAVFVVPLILLTGAFLSSAISGEILVRDLTSGYHDRLVLTHGSALPLLLGPAAAAAVVVTVQAVAILAGSLAIGFRADLADVAALLALTVVVGLSLTPFVLASALRFGTSAAVNAIPTLFFSLSFFTGFLAPSHLLGGWMRTVASVNPLTPVLDTMRGTVDPTTTTHPAATGATLVVMTLVGTACCVAAARWRRRTR